MVLKVGHKIDLPCWLGSEMAKRGVIELKKPKFLTQAFFNQLEAGAEVVTLSNHSPYIYELACKLISMYPTETMHDSMHVFQTAFIDRFLNIILDYSNNATEQDA